MRRVAAHVQRWMGQPRPPGALGAVVRWTWAVAFVGGGTWISIRTPSWALTAAGVAYIVGILALRVALEEWLRRRLRRREGD